MDQINEIKQKLDVVDVVGSYVSLKKSGRNYKGLCPFHSEDSPSFMVSQELQIYKCFGCGEAGDMYKFVEKIEGVEFPQALEILADKAGIKLEKRNLNTQQDAQKKIIYEINHLASEYYYYLLTKHEAGSVGLTYLKEKRGLTDKTIKDFKLGFAPESWDSLYKALTKKGYKIADLLASGVIIPRTSGQGYLDKFRGRVMFPLTSIDGKVVGFTGRTVSNQEPKYLNTGETAVFQKSSILYALDKAKIALKKEGCVFVEGQMDVISAHQAGINNVIASSGTAVTINQLKIISRYTKDLIFCFDSDSAGEMAAQRAFELAEKEGFNIKVALIPEGFKDLDEVIKSNINKAKSMVENSIPAYDFLIITAIKKHDKHTAIGKKKIIESLMPVFSRLSNKVLMDHYTKKISEELDVTETVISELMSKKTLINEFKPETKNSTSPVLAKLAQHSSEDYLLALMLKAPLDSQKTLLYKLEAQDFTNTRIQKLFTCLKAQSDAKKEFNIQNFIDTIDSDLKEVVSELYLWDLGNLSEEPTDYLQEINATFARIRKDTIKRELKNLSSQIKQAETEKDSELLKDLSIRFKDLQKLYAETN